MYLFTYVEARIGCSPQSYWIYFVVECLLSLQVMFSKIDWKLVVTSDPPASALLRDEILRAQDASLITLILGFKL